jgi:hypothetical protein
MGVTTHTAARWCRDGQVESWRMGARGAHRIPSVQFSMETIVRLAFPRRMRDFFREADRLKARMERCS